MKKFILLITLLIPISSFSLNDPASFKSFNNPTFRIFIVANANYKTGATDLKYTTNDATLYKALFQKVLGVKNSHIQINKNLTVDSFDKAFKKFKKTIKKDELVVIIYSGHGQKNGMPQMVDGKSISVENYNSYFKSFFT